MIIKEIIIENYLCYYDVKRFTFSDGFNIILGENGEGKTKFFEALEWLFNGDNNDLEQLVSKKALAEREIDETFRVRVEIIVEQYNETKILSKYFTVKKINNDTCNVSNTTITGIEESSNGERTPISGKILLEQIFPTEIRRYSMFKGESELNIFDNKDALKHLINLFSEAKYYEKYEKIGDNLLQYAEKAVSDNTRLSTKNKNEYDKLEREISLKQLNLNRIIELNNLEEVNKNNTLKNIEEVEKFINNAEALETINKRIKSVEEDIRTNDSLIDENYTTSLFDDKWILYGFQNIHNEFTSKIKALSIERRSLQSKFDKELGRLEGEKKAKLELLKDLVPLPVGTPSKAIMEEMINDKFCKVCNRPAEEGSEALKYMEARLLEFIETQKKDIEKEDKTQNLYQNNYTDSLVYMSTELDNSLGKLRNIDLQIKDVFEFNQTRKEKSLVLNSKLKNEEEERERIIGKSSLGAEKLSNVLKNYNSWQQDIKRLNIKISNNELEIGKLKNELSELKSKKEAIDLKTTNSFFINTRNIISLINNVFKDTKQKKFIDFINQLSLKSNEIFSKINKSAFTGKIAFILQKHDNIKIQLQEGNDKEFLHPNQSLLTSMHISILLAIAELTKEIREEGYPLIFDAPTSSFGGNKMTEFLNLVYETSNQKIILLKDYIGQVKDDNGNVIDLFIKEDFNFVNRDNALWVKLQRPFDEEKLETINTNIIEL